MENKLFYLILFIVILALSRIIPHPPNFTPILSSAIMAPLLIRDRLYGVTIPILAMFISDLIIGFHNYQFVIYLTILFISLISPMKKNYYFFSIVAVGSSVWFFITTNFAVWLISDFYPKNIDGLLICYTVALPFFKNTLISTCLFTGLLLISIQYLSILNEKFNYFISNLMNIKN